MISGVTDALVLLTQEGRQYISRFHIALKAIKKFDVSSGPWREMAVVWGSKAGFFSVDRMSEDAALLGSVKSWLNSAGGGGRTFPELGHL